MGKPGFPTPLREGQAFPRAGGWGNPVSPPPSPRAYVVVFEKLIRYAGLAVGLKPSATECEARLRGLERIMYSKTITLGDR